jgi:alkanesulfonate monooxygenase SsuD/methylene tetrahydromethanopterin reductase-like flavin-dependent oxidoreductase (luciferase family)
MARPLRVGVQLPEVERVVDWPEYAALAKAAEEAGFDSIWLGDHMLYRDDGAPERGPWDAWTMLAALAAATSRVRLGPLVACTAFHPPGVLARMAAAVNEISDGRLVFGLGTGWNEAEFHAFGIPFDNRVSRFAEAFELVRRLLAGERVTYSGRFHEVEDAVLLPPPSRRLALMIGTAGPRILGLTLPHVDAWNCWYSWYGNSPDGFAALNGKITAVAKEAGRDPAEVERSACVLVGFGEARERLAEEGVSPVRPEGLAEHLTSLTAAGADEAILVLDPINEESIRALGPVLAVLDGNRPSY